MKQILIEANKLICNDGEVWLWNSESLDGVRHFSTKDDAQKYIDLRHQLSREKGWKEERFNRTFMELKGCCASAHRRA